MKTKSLTILLMLLTLTGMAQKKTFTLDELIPGGNRFWALQPERKYFTLWGEQAVRQDAETVYADGKVLFQKADIDTLLKASDDKVAHLYGCSFPYPDKPLVKLTSYRSELLYNFKTKRIEWQQPRTNGKANDWHPESKATAYVKDHNLFVRTAEGADMQVSQDGTRELVYGQSVHRDEFGIRKGTFWSPTGTALAFYRMDQSMVTDYPQVNIDTRIATEVPDKYPMAGEASHKVSIGIYRPATQQTVYLQTGDNTDRYFTNIAWSPDEKTLYVIELPRTQDKAELVAYDAATGKRHGVLYTETNAKYVEPQYPIAFLPWDSDKFIYFSQRDGFNHMYLMSVTKGEIKQLTKGKFVVNELLGFDISQKAVIYTSTEAHSIQFNAYRVSVANGKRTLLDNGKGTHQATLSASGATLLDTYSSPDVPYSINLINTRRSSSLNLFTAAEPWADYDVPQVSLGTLKAADGSTDLYYRLIKPTNFDPSKRYPTVIYVYGGPHARLVDNGRHYGARGWEFYMAQQGYVVFVLDNRGSADRGFAFESVIHRQLGTEEMKDQMEGVKFLKTLPYVDANRLGVHGWSFGGFMTTNLMLTHPDVFKVGVAGGPVIDWKYYEVMYGERYMDTPQENAEGYKANNLNLRAGNLKGRLQIIHGYNDPVCVPQHPLSFLQAAAAAGTQPDAFFYPGEGHNMAGKNRVHLHERITRYFDDYLK